MYDFGPILSIFLTGCRPWPPPVEPGRPCPVCDRGVNEGDDTTVCGICHSTSPRSDRRLHAAYIAAERRTRHAAAAQAIASNLRKKSRVKGRAQTAIASAPTLTERQRRGYWYGGSRRFSRGYPGLPSTIAACRAWLKEIGQEPDWSQTHDRLGPLPARRELPERN